MSEIRRVRARTPGRVMAMVTLAIASPAVSARGQDIPRIEARIERLRERARILDAKADSVTEANRRRWAGTLDTVRQGSLLMLSPREMTDDARQAGALAWSALLGVFGDSVALLLDGRTFVAMSDEVVDSARSDIRWHADLGTPVLAPKGNRAQGLAMNVVNLVYQAFWQRLDRDMRDWLSAPLMPTLEPGTVPGSAYVELVTANSPLARACFLGDLAACGKTLGLNRPADPAMSWYTPEERRALVSRLSQSLRNGTDRFSFAQCVDQSSDSSCARVLRDNPGLVPPVLSAPTRGTFLVTALRSGASGALSRLLQNPGDPIATRIESAAGASSDVLLGDWRTAVIRVKPVGTQLSPAAACTSVLWMAGLLTLAVRSSRWR